MHLRTDLKLTYPVRISNKHLFIYLFIYCLYLFIFIYSLANDYRVVLSSDNGQSDYICASYVDVSEAWGLDYQF